MSDYLWCIDANNPEDAQHRAQWAEAGYPMHYATFGYWLLDASAVPHINHNSALALAFTCDPKRWAVFPTEEAALVVCNRLRPDPILCDDNARYSTLVRGLVPLPVPAAKLAAALLTTNKLGTTL